MTDDTPSALDADLGLSEDDLQAAERDIGRAMSIRSADGLRVLGFGENSVAIAYPAEAPRAVLKRAMASKESDQAELRQRQVADYIRAVEPFVVVAPTELRVIRNADHRFVPYMVQHLYDNGDLVETRLAADTPSPTHEIVLAVRDAAIAATADGRQALDAQFSNFAWVDGRLEYFDVGLPFLFENGESTVEAGDALQIMPAPLRPLVEKVVRKTLVEMSGARGTLTQAAMSLPRMGLDHWVEPVLVAFNEVLDEPLRADDIAARTEELHKRTAGLKRLMQLQRAWATKVRRQPYDTFITNSFTGDLL